MAASSEARLARTDAAIVAVWAGLSLFVRRLLGPFPVAADPQAALADLVQLGPAKLIWLPLIFHAGLLPLAVILLHRTYSARSRVWMRFGSAAGAIGFGLYAVALSLNLVEATTAGAALAVLPGAPHQEILDRFVLLWRADQALSIGVLVLLGSWVAAVSRAGQSAGFSVWPRWFSAGGVAAALITIGAGVWGVISQGALATVDGGDGLILVHLWIGLASTLIWQQYGARRAPS